ncbi:hypothetical protein [Streptacidiphilus sp. PAMC 29251]
MISLIVAAVLAAYSAVGALIARRLYGRWRAASIDDYVASYSKIGSKPPEVILADAVKFFDNHSRGDDQLGAFLNGLFWPLSVPTITLMHLTARFLSNTPVRADSEIKAEHAQMAARIAELEKELGYQ